MPSQMASSAGHGSLVVTFRLPFGDKSVEGSVCNVPAESERAQVLKQACLIVWDEIVMSGKYSPVALDLTLTDLMHNDKPLGGKCVLMSGIGDKLDPC